MTNMSSLTLLLATAVIVYLCRFSGFTLSWLAASPRLARFLHFVPIAVFAALIVPSVISEPVLLGYKMVALAAAAVAIRRTRHFGLGIITGLGLFWILAN